MNRAQISATGSPIATRREFEKVFWALGAKCHGPSNAVTAADLALLANVPGRTCRSAYAAMDGIDFVLGHCPQGIFVAETPEQAASLTAELRAKAVDMLARADRRDAWFAQQRTPLRQLALEIAS